MNKDDLISRQAAIDTYLETVSSLCVDEGDGVLTACARDRDILEMLENLPSVQPKTGRWKKTLKSYEDEEQAFDYYEITCSECGGEPENEYHLTRFCPSCGARMEGGEEHG